MKDAEKKKAVKSPQTAENIQVLSDGNSPSMTGSALHWRRILVCLDRSFFSEACVPYVVSLAKTFHSALTLVHVLHSHDPHSGPPTRDALSWEISRQEAQGYLERLQKEASEALGRSVDIRLEQGHTAERIVDLAQEIGADITVLGSHREDGITSWTIGTTTQHVLALARRSVLIAHSSASIVRAAVTPKRILVPLDGSIRSESVLPTAAYIAKANKAEMLLVHVVQEPPVTALLNAAKDMELAQTLAARLESSAKQYLERLRWQLAHESTPVKTLVIRHVNERQGLLDVSLQEQADFIVLSAHGSACDPARSFGGVTTYLLTHSLVPLLVLQDLPEAELHPRPDVDANLTPRPSHASYAPQSA